MLWDSKDALQAIYCQATCDNGPDLDLNRERARAEKERADKLELENAVRHGQLLEAADLALELSKLLTNFKSRITSLPSKLSSMVDDVDDRRRLFIEAKATTDEALNDLAKGMQKRETKI